MTEILYFTPEQANLFLESVRGSKYYPLYALVLVSGLRLGEVIALRNENVDLNEGKISVKLNAAIVSKEVQTEKGVVHSEVVLQTPKTKKSMRTLYIEEPIITIPSREVCLSWEPPSCARVPGISSGSAAITSGTRESATP